LHLHQRFQQSRQGPIFLVLLYYIKCFLKIQFELLVTYYTIIIAKLGFLDNQKSVVFTQLPAC
jgi:hypothetical protein